VGVFSRE